MNANMTALAEAPMDQDDSGMDLLWRIVAARDARYDGALFVGVKTTGIYCKPSCPSRCPKPQNVVFFPNKEMAVEAGFRACKRCRPEEVADAASDPRAEMVIEACRLLEADDAPELGDICTRLGIAERRLREAFADMLGTSPSRYAAAARMGRFRHFLRQGESVTFALYDAGFGAPSRIYERAGNQLGMTPATYAKGGRGAVVHFSVEDTPLGPLLVAGTEKGLALVRFGESAEALEGELRDEFHAAEIRADAGPVADWAAALSAYVAGRAGWPDLPVDVISTAFQARVWAALKDIPEGVTASYGDIARAIGAEGAARAVGTACGANRVALVIPCHRVLPTGGGFGGYRWGVARKKALLEREEKRTSGAE